MQKEMIQNKKSHKRIRKIIVLVLIIILLLFLISNKIVKKQIHVYIYFEGLYSDLEDASSQQCKDEIPKNCKFITWRETGGSSDYDDCVKEGRSNCWMCYDCGYSIIDCFYIC